MNEFLKELRSLLVANHSEDVDSIVEYFEEYIEDKKESGELEEDILDELGTPTDIVSEILERKVVKNNINGLITIIDADVKSLDIEITTDDVEEVFVEKDENANVYVETRDNVLTIKQLEDVHNTSFFNRFSQVIKVKLPEDSHLEEVKVSSASGDLYVEGSLYIESLGVRSMTGDIEFDEVEINQLSLKLKSGDVEIEDSNIHQASINTLSGDIDIEDVSMETCDIDMKSGDIDIDNLEVNSLSARTLSGDIDIHLVGDREDYTIQENHKIYGSGEHNIKVSTLSGDIDIDYND